MTQGNCDFARYKLPFEFCWLNATGRDKVNHGAHVVQYRHTQRQLIEAPKRMRDFAQIEAFKLELAGLLAKYDATIGASFDGDTHGIYDEKIGISIGLADWNICGLSIDAQDLKGV